ncbi:MAG: patatin-like phospholipase family protein [Burkholderiales bacterium]|nr:patatin-like phospholipase family protein [Burkholderiales bacterium]
MSAPADLSVQTTPAPGLPPSPVGRNALVLTGGGARAAYQVGVLMAVKEVLGNPRTNPFPIISGTSAGAINAAVLAMHADDFSAAVDRLYQVWSNFHPSHVYRSDPAGVFANSAYWIGALLFGALVKDDKVSLFDNEPLRGLLQKEIDFGRIGSHIDAGHLRAFSVTASGYTSGQSCTFFQGAPDVEGWKRSQRVGIASKLRVDHLMASAAIPFAFPAIKVNREYFGDGSMRQMAPVSPALHLGADRVFVVGTAKLKKELPQRISGHTYPSLAQIAGHAMSSIFLDTLVVDLELLARINTTIMLVDPAKLRESGMPLHHVDVCVACPTQSLDQLAPKYVGNLPWAIRFLLRSIGAMRKGGATLASYMLFDKDYCQALIRMGYDDTLANRDDIKLFFDPNARPNPMTLPQNNYDPTRTATFDSPLTPPSAPTAHAA